MIALDRWKPGTELSRRFSDLVNALAAAQAQPALEPILDAVWEITRAAEGMGIFSEAAISPEMSNLEREVFALLDAVRVNAIQAWVDDLADRLTLTEIDVDDELSWAVAPPTVARVDARPLRLGATGVEQVVLTASLKDGRKCAAICARA